MPIDFQCPHCGLRTSVDIQYSGQSGPCVGCGKTVTIPRVAVHPRYAHTRQQPTHIQCTACGYTGEVLVAHHGYKWWTIPAGIVIGGIGVGLIPLIPRMITPIVIVIVILLLGNRTYRACPSCKNRQLAAWPGQVSENSRTIWQTAKASDEKAFRTNKLILLAVVVLILLASLVLMYAEMRRYM